MHTKLLILLFLITLKSFSQETWISKYDDEGTEILTDSNDYAYRREFLRVNNSTSSFIGFTNENVKYESGILKNNFLHGRYESYFPNGKINFEGEYKNDNPIGIWLEYYSNGNKKSEYSIVGESETDYLKNIISSWDSLGSPLIINGNGRQTVFQKGFKIEEIYKNGVLDGEIKVYDGNKVLFYSENFVKGKFVNGFNHFLNIEYTSIYSLPEYKEGNGAFEKFVYNYVKKEFKEKVGNPLMYMPNGGEIKLEITVSKNGEVKSVKLVNSRKSLVSDIFVNAIRETTNNWQPSMLRGEKIEKTFMYFFHSDGKTSTLKRIEKINDWFNTWSIMDTLNVLSR